jgi:CheY-like chemotaxis protein
MQAPLTGCSILVVEDEPLIAMDIAQAFDTAGAALTTTNTLRHALILVEHDGLSGAILDHARGDGDSSRLCARFTERGIHFVIYSGHATVGGPCASAPHITEPAAQGARGQDGKPHLKLRLGTNNRNADRQSAFILHDRNSRSN